MTPPELQSRRRSPYWVRVIAATAGGTLTGLMFASFAAIAYLIGAHEPGDRLLPIVLALVLTFAGLGALGGLLHPLARSLPAAVALGALCGAPLYLVVAAYPGVSDESPSGFEARVLTVLGAVIGAGLGWRLWREFTPR